MLNPFIIGFSSFSNDELDRTLSCSVLIERSSLRLVRECRLSWVCVVYDLACRRIAQAKNLQQVWTGDTSRHMQNYGL
jgi:hypothetical protein